jgi:hypothetical protein
MTTTRARPPRLPCSRRAAALFVATAIGGLAGGCALSVEGELPAIEITRRDIRIPAVPLEGRRISEGMVAVPVFVEPHERLVLPREAYESVKVREVVLTARSGVNDLSFVRTFRMTINSLEGHSAGTPPIEMARYERTQAYTGPILSIPASPPVEIVTPWRAATVVINLEVAGTLPEEAWVLDVTARMSATVNY